MTDNQQPPPDPAKVKVQVVVDVVCLILSVVLALAVATVLLGFRQPGDTASEILCAILALVGVCAVVVIGVAARTWARGLFGVTDTTPEEEEEAPDLPVPPDAEEDDVSEPTVCLKCGARIPAGTAECPHCGWTYRPN
jgi:ribosomal protein L40E